MLKTIGGAVLFLTLITGSVAAPEVHPNLPANHLKVPLVRQAASFSCGAGAMLAVLQYWQVFDGKETDLYEPLSVHEENGTHPRKMRDLAKAFGLAVEMRENTTIANLKDALARGETVVLDLQAWPDDELEVPWASRWDAGHYLVLVGMDDSFVYVMDPSVPSAYAYFPLQELMDRWHDWEEEPNGKRWENHQLALFIKGETPSSSFPGPLVRTE